MNARWTEQGSSASYRRAPAFLKGAADALYIAAFAALAAKDRKGRKNGR